MIQYFFNAGRGKPGRAYDWSINQGLVKRLLPPLGVKLFHEFGVMVEPRLIQEGGNRVQSGRPCERVIAVRYLQGRVLCNEVLIVKRPKKLVTLPGIIAEVFGMVLLHQCLAGNGGQVLYFHSQAFGFIEEQTLVECLFLRHGHGAHGKTCQKPVGSEYRVTFDWCVLRIPYLVVVDCVLDPPQEPGTLLLL